MTPSAAGAFQIGAGTWGPPERPANYAHDLRSRLAASNTPGVGRDASYLQNITTQLWGEDGAAAETEPHKDTVSAPIWLDTVYSLVARGAPDDAIDVLFDHVDDLLITGEFRRCNDLLHAVDLARLDTDLLVALLSITLPAAPHLRDRPWLVQRVEKRLQEIAPDRIEGLMRGLR